MVIQKHRKIRNAGRPSAALLTTGLLLVATFAFGGSARGDEIGLIVLRPISTIALLISLYLLKIEDIHKHKFWTAWLVSIVVLTLLHLIPLPPSLWHQLPGRELAVDLDSLLGLPQAWRPLSLSPEMTRNALWSMIGPLACFLLMIQLSWKEASAAFALIIVLGLISGLVSVIQITEGPGSFFYFYRITNLGMGVGLFANRNHQAVLLVCLIPIGFALAAIAVRANATLSPRTASTLARWGMGLGAIFVFILVIVTGSRAGLILFGVAMALIFMLARRQGSFVPQRSAASSKPTSGKFAMVTSRPWLLLLPIGAVVAAVLLSGRYESLQRLTDSSIDGEARFTIVGPLIEAIKAYLPFGSGIGTFEPVFKGYESADILTPTYWNHAHNDWAELVLTGGIPAVIIVAVGAFWLIRFYVAQRREKTQSPDLEAYRFIGGSVLALIALSSFGEYPLRVPIMSCLFVMSIALLSKASLGRAR